MKALNVTVFADDETLRNLELAIVIPTVIAIASLAGTTPSYTSQFAAEGVPSVFMMAILYVAPEAAVLVTKIVEITAVLFAAVLYSVAYVDVDAVPCT